MVVHNYWHVSTTASSPKVYSIHHCDSLCIQVNGLTIAILAPLTLNSFPFQAITATYNTELFSCLQFTLANN